MSILKSLLNGTSLSGAMVHMAEGRGRIDKEAVTAIREAFSDAQKRDLKLSDETINGIFNSEKWDELDEDEQMELLLKSETMALSVMVTDPGISLLVSKIDDTAEEEITACIDAAMKNKTTAVDVYAQFKRIYTKDELDGMPYPGTKPENVTGNQRPDVTTKSDQTGKMITVTWTNDFVSAMGRGKELENTISDVKKEQNSPGSVPHLKGLAKSDLASILSDATARRNALRSMVKRAISVHHQWEDIEAMPLIGIEWITGKANGTIIPNKFGASKGKPVTGSPKPIWIFPKDNPGKGRDFSVTQLLAFDPAMARNMPEGGTMAELVATAATGAAPPEGDTEKTVDDFTNDVVDYAAVLNQRANMALLLTKVAPVKDKSDTSADDLLVSICGLVLNLLPIYQKNKGRYESLIAKEEEEPARKSA